MQSQHYVPVPILLQLLFTSLHFTRTGLLYYLITISWVTIVIGAVATAAVPSVTATDMAVVEVCEVIDICNK